MKFGRSVARLAAPALLADAPPKVAGEREFNVLTALARAIPRVRGAGRVRSAIARFYLRKRRGAHEVRALGAELQLRNVQQARDEAGHRVERRGIAERLERL